MDAQLAIDWTRETILIVLTLAAPPLLAALAVGLIVGALQSMTQLHDPAVGLIPRLLAVVLVLMATLPWLLQRWASYASDLIQSIPGRM